jgi:hypothetical protein
MLASSEVLMEAKATTTKRGNHFFMALTPEHVS